MIIQRAAYFLALGACLILIDTIHNKQFNPNHSSVLGGLCYTVLYISTTLFLYYFFMLDLVITVENKLWRIYIFHAIKLKQNDKAYVHHFISALIFKCVPFNINNLVFRLPSFFVNYGKFFICFTMGKLNSWKKWKLI